MRFFCILLDPLFLISGGCYAPLHRFKVCSYTFYTRALTLTIISITIYSVLLFNGVAFLLYIAVLPVSGAQPPHWKRERTLHYAAMHF